MSDDAAAELHAFSRDLSEIADGAYRDVDAVLKKGALNIKNEMIADVSKSPHFRGMAGSITFEHENTRDVIRRVIGPDKERKGGALGNIYFFGTSRGGGSGDIDKPLRNEEPRLNSALDGLLQRWADQI